MNLRSLLLTVIASATLSGVGAATINHDKVQPFPQLTPVTLSEKSAVKFKPSLIIKDGCHPYPAVNAVAVAHRCLQGWVPTSRHTACAWLARASRACS
ncbi:hypothetical protein PF001_g30988 [Phytophthora fragariae]|uniref:RxLR effector protein n=1 Tax=Phytophthora fragariae TaxID=53985 RepID=A0A6A4B155_9STRA|nr:hypothetical protein PF001_g30988 [Phytophthora fragariae]